MRLSRQPIVIGGCGRSGTTLLLSVLSCHPHILAIDQETRALCPGAYRHPPITDNPLKLKKIHNILIRLDIPASCRRWCEKTPRNVLYFGKILQYFGKRVRIVHLVRDGRDVITSTHPSQPDIYWIRPERWIADLSSALKYENHPQVLTVRYEDLICKYDQTMRIIYQFLDEPYDDKLYPYPDCARMQTDAAWFGAARPIDSRSIGRWRQPRHGNRIAAFQANVQAVNILRHYGYV